MPEKNERKGKGERKTEKKKGQIIINGFVLLFFVFPMERGSSYSEKNTSNEIKRIRL